MTDPAERTAVTLLYPGCTIAEVIELATRLANHGVQTVFAASDDAAITDASGLSMQPDTTLADVDPAIVDAVIVPGGDPGSIIGNADVEHWLRQAEHALVAGICAGVAVLAASGLTTGRHITHNYREPWAPPDVVTFVAHLWEGAVVEADVSIGVVRDERLITALPNATVDFTVAVLQSLELIDETNAHNLSRHLRGNHVPDLFLDGS
jgi:putative intracellular protease/amidase